MAVLRRQIRNFGLKEPEGGSEMYGGCVLVFCRLARGSLEKREVDCRERENFVHKILV